MDISLRKNNTNWNDNINLLMLFFSSAFCAYIFPSLKTPFYFFLLILYFFSKRDYIWFVYIFILIQSPGQLFQKPYDSIISITSTVHVSISYAFVLVAFYKYRIHHKLISTQSFLRISNPIMYYMIFLSLISLFFGINAGSLIFMFYIWLAYLFFPLFKYVIYDKHTLYKIVSLLFFSVVILFIWQLHDVIFTNKLYTYFGVETSLRGIGNTDDGFKLNRLFYAAAVNLITLFSSLFFLLQKNHFRFSRNYLYFIAFVSYLSMFLTATRGYIIMYTLIFIIFSFYKKGGALKFIFLSGVSILTLIFLFPIINNQFDLALDRIGTIFNLLEGDSTASNTLIRLTDRAPRVWNKFIESPVFGFGLSSEGRAYNDDHVGNYTLLLQGGVLGFLLWIYVFLNYIYRLLSKSIYLKNKETAYFTIGYLFSLWIAHSTSSAIFSYYLSIHMVFIFAYLLNFIKIELNIK